MPLWKIKINGGPEQDHTTKSRYYDLAAISALATLPFQENTELDDDGDTVQYVKIWEPTEGTFGPYYYGFTQDRRFAELNKRHVPEKFR